MPGIGTVDLVCRPNSTQVRIRPNSRAPETQMWMAKFEDKGGREVVAVKNVRVYTYATAADNGRGGTGARAHEGLNQRPRIEDFQTGNAYGVISQRPGRNQEGQGALTTPATSFKLTWWWERFDYPGHQYCNMALTLHTDTARQFGLSWHGDAEAAGATTSTTTIPGFGTAIVTCETGRSNAYDQTRRPPADPSGTRGPSWTTIHHRRGRLDNQVEELDDLDYDPETGLLGPVDLPRNGMMRPEFAPTGSAGSGVELRAVVVGQDERRRAPGAQPVRGGSDPAALARRQTQRLAHQVEHGLCAGLDVGDRHPGHGVRGAVDLGQHGLARSRRS